jgi:nucleotide-binding universal stress UspA family protein
VITVFEHWPLATQATLVTGGATINELLREELRKNLDDLLAEQTEDLPVEGRFLEGSAGQVLARESADLDLLITGSRGYGPHAAVLLGSTMHALMREGESPVLVLPRGTGLDLGLRGA